MDRLKYALQYRRMGFSVIPIKPDKRPYLKWETYQRQKPTEDEIKSWWAKYPSANIGIITGEVSGIDVVDCDTEEAYLLMNEDFLSDTFTTPVVKTPNGYHIYFKHKPGLSNSVRAINGTDLRTTGGYVVAPPSKNGHGVYSWFNGLSPKDCDFQYMPEYLFDLLHSAILNNSNNNIAYNNTSINSSLYNIYNNSKTHANSKLTTNGDKTTTNEHKQQLLTTKTTTDHNDHKLPQDFFTSGRRDNDLFHIANSLVKGDCNSDMIGYVLETLADSCSPPFNKSELNTKIISALKRQDGRDRNITQEVTDWVFSTSGIFTTSQCHIELQLKHKNEKKAANMALLRMVGETIEKVGDKNGNYRLIDISCEKMDWMNADSNYKYLWMPLGLGDIAGVLPGNIIMFAGEKDSGKSSFLLNIAKENRYKYEVHYFNSEMGPSELKMRLSKFDDISIDMWKNVSFYERSDNFHDVIKSGEGKLNIIDFLEAPTDVWKVGSWIQKIHQRLDGAICVIAIQKKIGADLGRGAEFSMEKARLYVSLNYGKAKIISCKNFKEESPLGNPRGAECVYKIVHGSRIMKGDSMGWHR